MRHKGINKEETRKNMLAAVGRGFREHGFAGIGVDYLAKAAGVTSGAFYSHFGSKNGAFGLALEDGLDEVVQAIPRFQEQHRDGWVKAFAEYYVGKVHRADLACGCAMATLTSEVVRTGPEMHTLYEKKMQMIVSLIAQGLAGGTEEERIARSWAMLGILIGGINMARAMKTSRLADNVSETIKESAIKVAGRTRSILPSAKDA